MAVSDFQINSRVRGVFARHWIDLQKINFASFRGTVRVSGELCLLGSERSNDFEPTKIVNLEYEIKRIPEVKRVYFEFPAWHRKPDGAWERTDGEKVGTTSYTKKRDERRGRAYGSG